MEWVRLSFGAGFVASEDPFGSQILRQGSLKHSNGKVFISSRRNIDKAVRLKS